jgi:filamentous hemagglutinin
VLAAAFWSTLGPAADNCGGLADCASNPLAWAIILAALALLALALWEFGFLAFLEVEAEAALETGAFRAGAGALGEGLGSLEGVSLEASSEGLAQVEAHLAQFGEWGPNEAMLERIGTALANGETISGADAVFYTHELAESTLMQQGMTYAEAHAAALEQYGVSPFSVYAAEVVEQFPALFNNAWRAFWGLPLL